MFPDPQDEGINYLLGDDFKQGTAGACVQLFDLHRRRDTGLYNPFVRF